MGDCIVCRGAMAEDESVRRCNKSNGSMGIVAD